MLAIKYALRNIWKTKSLYIPVFYIATFTLVVIMAAAAIRPHVSSALEGVYGEYAAIAITRYNDLGWIWLGSNHAKRTSAPMEYDGLVLSDAVIAEIAKSATNYVTGYYAFTQIPFTSTQLQYVAQHGAVCPLCPVGDHDLACWQFSIIAYTDISMSTHFRLNDRSIIDGRFAENANETNISTDLADLNGLAVGDIIEVRLSHPLVVSAPHYIELEIVGIFSDNTNEIGNELNLIYPGGRFFDESVRCRFSFASIRASVDNLSRNQLLTTVSSAVELTAFYPSYALSLVDGQMMDTTLFDWGHSVAVFYVDNEHKIQYFVETICSNIYGRINILDSGAGLRLLSDLTSMTASALLRYALIFGAVTLYTGDSV